jgi:membrane protease YdiL (CAAX protease family)
MVALVAVMAVVVGLMCVLTNYGTRANWARVASYVITTLQAVQVGLWGIVLLVSYTVLPTSLIGSGRLVGLLCAVLLLLDPVAVVALFDPRFRKRVARILPIDPDNPVHTVALGLSLTVAVTVVATQFLTASLPSSLNLGLGSLKYSRADVVSSELLFLVIGFLGVGLFVRRTPRETMARLGLVKPTWWQPVLALGLAGLLYWISDGLERLGRLLTPELSRHLESVNQALFSQLTDPVSALLVGVAAGVGEEVLFRGALQPRLGIVFTTIIFGAMHVNYALSFSLLSVLLIGVALALLRKYTNTTTSIITHSALDIIGLGLAATAAYVLTGALVVAAVLLLGVALLWSQRAEKRREEIPSPLRGG